MILESVTHIKYTYNRTSWRTSFSRKCITSVVLVSAAYNINSMQTAKVYKIYFLLRGNEENANKNEREREHKHEQNRKRHS